MTESGCVHAVAKGKPCEPCGCVVAGLGPAVIDPVLQLWRSRAAHEEAARIQNVTPVGVTLRDHGKVRALTDEQFRAEFWFAGPLADMRVIRVLVVDDHPFVRSLLKRLFRDDPQVQVVGEAADGQEAMEKTFALEPDVVLLDLNMPISGLEAIAPIKAKTKAKVLVVTAMSYPAQVASAVTEGADGLVSKLEVSDVVLKAIHDVFRGERVWDPKLLGEVVEHVVIQVHEALSPREREVFRLAAKNETNEAIAIALNISLATVRTHTKTVMRKLGVHTRLGLVIYGLRTGLVMLDELKTE